MIYFKGPKSQQKKNKIRSSKIFLDHEQTHQTYESSRSYKFARPPTNGAKRL